MLLQIEMWKYPKTCLIANTQVLASAEWSIAWLRLVEYPKKQAISHQTQGWYGTETNVGDV